MDPLPTASSVPLSVTSPRGPAIQLAGPVEQVAGPAMNALKRLGRSPCARIGETPLKLREGFLSRSLCRERFSQPAPKLKPNAKAAAGGSQAKPPAPEDKAICGVWPPALSAGP